MSSGNLDRAKAKTFVNGSLPFLLRHFCWHNEKFRKSCLHLGHLQARFYLQIFWTFPIWRIPDENE